MQHQLGGVTQERDDAFDQISVLRAKVLELQDQLDDQADAVGVVMRSLCLTWGTGARASGSTKATRG